jgi:hypothetical protein
MADPGFTDLPGTANCTFEFDSTLNTAAATAHGASLASVWACVTTFEGSGGSLMASVKAARAVCVVIERALQWCDGNHGLVAVPGEQQ